jgi:hypothetical protein
MTDMRKALEQVALNELKMPTGKKASRLRAFAQGLRSDKTRVSSRAAGVNYVDRKGNQKVSKGSAARGTDMTSTAKPVDYRIAGARLRARGKHGKAVVGSDVAGHVGTNVSRKDKRRAYRDVGYRNVISRKVPVDVISGAPLTMSRVGQALKNAKIKARHALRR